MSSSHEYDVFISYASEDRTIAANLSEKLRKSGLKVWIDEAQLRIGDSISQEIGKALRRSRFGVLVMSRQYLSKPWPIEELKTLFQLQLSSGQRVILPLWHGIGKRDVEDRFPFLMDIKALSTSRMTLDQIAQEVCDVAKKVRTGEEPHVPIESGTVRAKFKLQAGGKAESEQSYLVRTLSPAKMKKTLLRTVRSDTK